MSSIFDITTTPSMLQRVRKAVVFNCRRPKPDYIDEELVLERLKSFGLDFVLFDCYEDFYENQEQYEAYSENILFLNEAPKTKEESEVIYRLQPKYILWVTYPHFFIALAEYTRHNLKLKNEPIIPFTVFSSALERCFLYHVAKMQDISGSILEIGAYSGGTSLALALGNRASNVKNIVFSVDRQFQDDYDYFMKNAGVEESIVKSEYYSKEFSKLAKETFIKHSQKAELRILWIDGDHSYEGTKFDIATYSKYLKDGGILMIHDYGLSDSHHGGIPRAVWEELVNNDEYSNFAVIGSIFYAQKNRKEKFVDFSNISSAQNSPANVLNWLSKKYDFKDKKVFLYGAGLHTDEILKLAQTHDREFYNSVVALIDDNRANQGNMIHNKIIMSLDRAKMEDFDFIIPSSFDYESKIIRELDKNGVEKKKIVPIYTNDEYLKDMQSKIPLIRDFDMLESVLKMSYVE